MPFRSTNRLHRRLHRHALEFARKDEIAVDPEHIPENAGKGLAWVLTDRQDREVRIADRDTGHPATLVRALDRQAGQKEIDVFVMPERFRTGDFRIEVYQQSEKSERLAFVQHPQPQEIADLIHKRTGAVEG